MKLISLRSACTLALFCPGSAAFAQSQSTATNQGPPSAAVAPSPPVSATTSPGAPTASSSGEVEEIVVTAQRRSESLQSVPVAVTALSAATLENAGIANTTDLARVTPGLTTPDNAGFAIPHLRGIGTTGNAAGIENAVATYIDGVYISAAPSSLLSLNNVDRIEVLKGPQGTLFGRNATGGLIQVITKDPKQAPSGAFNVSYGNYDDATFDLYATRGLTDNLAADVSLRYEHQGVGFGTNLDTGYDTMRLDRDFAGRVKLLFTPTPQTRIHLSLDYEDSKSSLSSQHLGSDYAGVFNSGPFGAAFRPLPSPYDIDQNIDPSDAFRGGGITLQVNQDVGPVSFQSITAYRRSFYFVPFDADFTSANFEGLNISQGDNQFSQEFQLSSRNPGRLKWVAGVFYFQANDSNRPFDITIQPSPLAPVPGTSDNIEISDAEGTMALAGYGQATYEIFKGTNFTFGARYSYEHKTFGGTQTFAINGTVVSDTGVPTPGIPFHASFNKPTYRVALDHQFGRHILGYVSYNTGFRSGGFNVDLASNPPYKAETITAYEVGLKNELLDRRLRLNVAAFHYDYDNIQVSRYVNSQEEILNGSSAELYGVDMDGELVVGYGLSLTGGLAYLHDRFTSFPNAPFITAVNGCTPAVGGVCEGSAAGNELPFAPTTTVNVGLTYKKRFDFGLITFAGDYFRSSGFYAAPDNALRQPAYDLGDASLTWTERGGKFSVKVYGKNLGSTVFATDLVENEQGPTRQFGAPRTYGLTLGARF